MCQIVPFQPEHTPGLVAAVRSVFDEYGFTWEADGYCRDLYDIRGHYIELGGMYWAVVDAGLVVGGGGVQLHSPVAELLRMYLMHSHRGRGLGRRLLETCMAYAREHGCRAMRAWSDVTLTDAHRLYEQNGFVRDGQRICNDPDKSLEHGFWKEPL